MPGVSLTGYAAAGPVSPAGAGRLFSIGGVRRSHDDYLFKNPLTRFIACRRGRYPIGSWSEHAEQAAYAQGKQARTAE
jgi:hypothetical protein